MLFTCSLILVENANILKLRQVGLHREPAHIAHPTSRDSRFIQVSFIQPEFTYCFFTFFKDEVIPLIIDITLRELRHITHSWLCSKMGDVQVLSGQLWTIVEVLAGNFFIFMDVVQQVIDLPLNKPVMYIQRAIATRLRRFCSGAFCFFESL